MAASTTFSLLSPLQSRHEIRSLASQTSTSRMKEPGFGLAKLPVSVRQLRKTVHTKQIKAVATTTVEETIVSVRPTWSEFNLGLAPVYWKTDDGLPPSSGGKLTLFYNPINKLDPGDKYGIAFNGGFNQPLMCGGKPRSMNRREGGEADPPFFTIKINVPEHAVNLIFSFTNGVDWDGPYKLPFQVPKNWRNKSIGFFNAGLATELNKEGACERAIYPDSNIIISSCAMIGNLNVEGGDRCELNLVPGCIDPSSPFFDPLANVDDGSCPIESDSEDA